MEKFTINPPQSRQDVHRTGESDSRRFRLGNQTLTAEPSAHQGPGERSSDPQETDQDLPVGVQESLLEVWVGGGLLQG